MKAILTIAASDTSAGAGIQQDLKTITALGHYGVTVTTALTAQSTQGVKDVMEVPTDFFRTEMETLLDDIKVDAVKIGVVPNKDIAAVIVETIKRLSVPVVLDPVLASTSGWQFLNDECVDYIRSELFPLCTLLTPNIPEAKRLLTSGQLPTNLLLKGGHGEGEELTDTLYMKDGRTFRYTQPRVATRNLHGTGCTMSSAIATLLATGLPLPEAVGEANRFVHEGIKRGASLNIGQGNGPLWMFPLKD